MSAILVAVEAEAMAAGLGAGPGLVGITKVLGWMVLKISSFMERTMRPVKLSPRFDLIYARFPFWHYVQIGRASCSPDPTKPMA